MDELGERDKFEHSGWAEEIHVAVMRPCFLNVKWSNGRMVEGRWLRECHAIAIMVVR